MNVVDARKLVVQAKAEEKDISAWIKCIDSKIADAAKRGDTFVLRVYRGVRMMSTPEQRQLISEHYVRQGFTVNGDCISWATPTSES